MEIVVPAVVSQEPAQPRQIPMEAAAAAPVGRPRASRTARAIDTLAIVVAPLLVPAAVLALTRSGPGRSIGETFSLGDFAFGVVAVAFAALTRSLVGRGEAWKLVSASAVIAMIFETAIAVAKDGAADYLDLAAQAKQCPGGCDLSAMHQISVHLATLAPTALLWLVAGTCCAVLCTVAIIVIWRDS